jgi:hypothetical protein
MFNNSEVISYLQANKILAMKLDNAVDAVGKQVAEQVKSIGAGATRALFYTSCFTDEYNDVCLRQKNEDIRFRDGVYRLLRHGDIGFEMLKVYFEELLKYKTAQQLEYIKKKLVTLNVHIAASSLTNAGFAMAAASAVRMGLNLSMEISALTGRIAGGVVGAAALYGIVQRAADSAHRLQTQYPVYYSALSLQNLEMMYFLIEPVMQRASALDAQWATEENIADIITRLIR